MQHVPMSPTLGPWIDHTITLVRDFTDEVLDGRRESYAEAATWIGLASEAVWRRWRATDGARPPVPSWSLLHVPDFVAMVDARPGFDRWRRARALTCVLALVPHLHRRGHLDAARAADLVHELRRLLDAETPSPMGQPPHVPVRLATPAAGACRRTRRRRSTTLHGRLGTWGPPRSSLRPSDARPTPF